ncbi:Rab proteins geranylgeranyltransferase component A [Talaromyces islandicus]|uniref:Rab proteins geranylgeranyltransferase n=1 Tax=Talaromyces islandicus TaxID=28573 RepID=A0A0U1LS17_TALIS|nr:Rab proteins geranylgeranyltransferase component A [Talaromyces islandicus]
MEALADTPWDVTISGTGLAQSLLALALSRSGKKILHVDKNSYYGGSEAAFSLQEAQEWVDSVNQDPRQGPFEDVSIHVPSVSADEEKKVAASRAYTLSLSPFIVYTRSKLIPTLVSSKVYRQLEFQAVGSWWIYGHSAAGEESQAGRLQRVPSSREDIFADDSISMKAKRMLIKFLRSINQPAQMGGDGDNKPVIEEDLDLPFPEYLTSRFNAPPELYDALVSLSLSQQSPQQTSAKFAVPRIKRHLASMGVFGPGFGSLLSRWGCGAEIAQVGCRALAVGGGVYVLGRGIKSIDAQKSEDGFHQVTLSDGEIIRSRYVVGSLWDLPVEENGPQIVTHKVARSISIISSPLDRLFSPTAEGGPVPAGAVVVVPGHVLAGDTADVPPIHLLIHSSETGECPNGQCVIYGSVSISGQEGQGLLQKAVDSLLGSFANTEDKPTVLWRLCFTQIGSLDLSDSVENKIHHSGSSDQVLFFPPPSLDLAFDDDVVGGVRAGWKAVVGDETHDDDFMKFEDREDYDDD